MDSIISKMINVRLIMLMPINNTNILYLHIEIEKVSRQAGRNYKKSPYVMQKSLFSAFLRCFPKISEMLASVDRAMTEPIEAELHYEDGPEMRISRHGDCRINLRSG